MTPEYEPPLFRPLGAIPTRPADSRPGVVLGLDLGSDTGYAILDETGGAISAGVWDIRPRRGESPGMRYAHLRRELVWALDTWRVVLVVYEQPHQRGGPATEYAYGCVATVQELAAERGLEHSTVHTATLKKFAVGSGRASKEDMIAAAVRIWPRTTGMNGKHAMSSDEADALWCAEYGRVEKLGLSPAARRGL